MVLSYDPLIKVFKALSDKNRLEILRLLDNKQEICACDLLEDLDLSQSGLSYHMKILSDADLINERSAGVWKHYSLKPTENSVLIDWVTKRLALELEQAQETN